MKLADIAAQFGNQKQPQDPKHYEEVKGDINDIDFEAVIGKHCEEFIQELEASTASYRTEIQSMQEDRAMELKKLEKSGKRR